MEGFFFQLQKRHVITTLNNCVVFRCVTDGSDHGDIYGLSGKSPAAQFSYPAFTFPGPQVRIKNVGLFVALEMAGELERERESQSAGSQPDCSRSRRMPSPGTTHSGVSKPGFCRASLGIPLEIGQEFGTCATK
jgi:hypothetical protein